MVESTTQINPLGVFLKASGKNVVRVEPSDFYDEKTGLTPDTTHTLLDESAGSNQVLVIYGYEIECGEEVNLKISANNVDILSTTDKKHDFGEGLLIMPNKSIEITESHTNATIPIKIRVRAAKYYLE